MSRSNYENDTKAMDETLTQVVTDVTPSGLAPLHVSTQKKITVKGLAIDVQQKAETLHELEEVVQRVQCEIQNLCTKNELSGLRNTLEMQLEIHAKEVHAAIEKSNLKLLEAVSASSPRFLKRRGDKEQVKTNHDEAENSDAGSDTPETFAQKTKDGSPIAQDWLESEATPFEKTILNQVQELVSNSKLSQEILLPARGSILDMPHLIEFKRNVSASGAANIMALFSFTGIDECTKQGYSLKRSIFNFLSSSGAPCACPENFGKQAA
jgi:hypothetical protein